YDHFDSFYTHKTPHNDVIKTISLNLDKFGLTFYNISKSGDANIIENDDILIEKLTYYILCIKKYGITVCVSYTYNVIWININKQWYTNSIIKSYDGKLFLYVDIKQYENHDEYKKLIFPDVNMQFSASLCSAKKL